MSAYVLDSVESAGPSVVVTVLVAPDVDPDAWTDDEYEQWLEEGPALARVSYAATVLDLTRPAPGVLRFVFERHS